MSRFVLLDTGPLGLLSHPRNSHDIQRWVDEVGRAGTIVTVPEIADYEVRRELMRVEALRGLRRLDALKTTLYYLPLTTETMLKAADLWAQARRTGRPMAEPAALDGDVILAAQASVVTNAGHDVIVATDNVEHLSIFSTAQRWPDIK